MKHNRLIYHLKKSKKETLFKRASIYASIVLILFVTVSILASSFFEKRFQSSSLKGTLNIFSTEQLVTFMGTVNPYFQQGLPSSYEPPSIQRLSFELATNIKPGDIRSLLGRELPGFAIFDTEILVAGEGTDYTTLPIESAPPLDVLLKEREVAEEKLKVVDSKDKPKPNMTTNGRKVVYVYQSHSYESFIPLLKGAKVPNDANSSNPKANMIRVGEILANEFEQRGIGTLQDRTNTGEKLLSRGWQHGNAYQLSRETVKAAVSNNTDITFSFDLHRDSLRREKTTAKINGKSYAKLMFVIGEANPNFEKNAQLAEELHKLLNQKFPGLSRGVLLKSKSEGNGLYNQDLSDRAALMEVGGVDNNLEEIQRSMEAFAEVFAEYYWKDEKVNAGSN
ncbi:stage II sporulation protein P [Pseudalkalibacillus berkeleyi]|uniref:Stage II sporulation protein P n=1 Tax=Pseudalkalibacillus berkeleyi TaxID=1069813 RepID=A0ABS9H060_9BACL|nr:stage II sporulation protein P [Pseudalkalibacillus berkeleyi]MCF6137325.1 stage II sporulation protein P [Pseudalkalibacillus berkeleyi]